jgi:hypothetical protein
MSFRAYECGVVISTPMCSEAEQQLQNLLSDFKEFLHWLSLIFWISTEVPNCVTFITQNYNATLDMCSKLNFD